VCRLISEPNALLRAISTKRKLKKIKKTFPDFKSDEQAEHFVDTADLSAYDFSQLNSVKFEFTNKDERINKRLPSALLAAVKLKAVAAGTHYQRFIRATLEKAVSGK
jgi:predicted DNA binding CopG/RHH family protein